MIPNGPFGNMFPYTNYHSLNLDWIIQIAKDFLDQYTHIQDLIDTGITDIGNKTDEGLADLQTKYEALEALLQEWYDTHSEDIANELAEALGDLNEWYDTHQNYLDDTLTAKISAFNTAADEKATLTIQSIPDDYTAFFDSVRGTYITNSFFTNNSYTNFIQVPPGVYFVYISTAGSYGFPAALGNSFYMSVSGTAYTSGYAFKTFIVYGNNKHAYYAVCGNSSTPSNPPKWIEIITPVSSYIIGANMDITSSSDITSFIDIPVGNYFIYMESAGMIDFPTGLGQSFYLTVSGTKPNTSYSFKTFVAYSQDNAMFTVCGNSTSTSNLPTWHTLSGARYVTENSFNTAGITHFMDIPEGNYLLLLNDTGDMGFPPQLGLSFLLEVSSKQNTSNNAFKTYRAYANNSYAMYTVCGTASTAVNPPTWYELTSHSYSIPKFDAALDSVKLLLLGDSITRGSGASNLSGTETFTTGLGTQTIYDTGNSWAIKFAEYMADEYPNVEVINHGWSGISIGQLATNIASFVPVGTTHCIIGLGVNSEGNTSFDASIKQIVKYLLDNGIKIFAWTSWLGTHPNMSNINTAGRVQAALIHAYHNAGIEPLCTYSIAKRYCDENDLEFMDVMQWQPDDEYVHPNDLGHEILFRIIREGFGF